MILDRFVEYKDSGVCWQYSIRLKNRQSDLTDNNFSESDIKDLKCGDFIFSNESKTSYAEINNFIKKHEWLGRMSLYPTHFFIARYKGILCAVVIMDMPTAFSRMLGDDTKKIERLISRGACISWSPKNLGSKLISFLINWMVKNTDYRLFTAYSDTEAKELGTIYQASNFYYLGQSSGANKQYKVETGRWVSDRYFRSRSVYKRIAKKLNITWDKSWQDGDKVMFSYMPENISRMIKDESKNYMNSCECRNMNKKHKYAFVKGKSKKETDKLRGLFTSRNKVFAYPKIR